MSDRMKRLIIALLIFSAYVAAGTSDYDDAVVQDRVTAEIRASAHDWAVASR